MHLSPHIFLYICIFLLRTFNFSFSKFQLYNTELSAIVTMLYIRPSEFIHLRAEFVVFYQPSPISPISQNLADTFLLSVSMSLTCFFFFFPNIFDPRLVESTDAELVDTEGKLYFILTHLISKITLWGRDSYYPHFTYEETERGVK